MPTSFVIGLAGGSCSGKSHLARVLGEELRGRAVSLSLDSYYLPDAAVRQAAKAYSFDEPAAFDWPLFREQLSALKRGEPVARPSYDFTVSRRREESVLVKPAAITVVDGILLLADPATRRLIDLKVFVSASPEVRLARRLSRDLQERGRNAERTTAQFLTSVEPMYQLHVEPSKRFADIVLDNDSNGANDRQNAKELMATLFQRLRWA